MKPVVSLLLVFFANFMLAASFAPTIGISSATRNIRIANEPHTSKTSLFGTIRFSGNANARIDTSSIEVDGGEDDKSFDAFLLSAASNPVLLGAETYTKLDDEGSGELWECKQASVAWFGLALTPIFINRIEKSSGNVVISIIEAQTQVSEGSRLGNTIATAMKRSEFEGRNVVSWKERAGSNNAYVMEGDLRLTLTINLPRFLPLPPGFNTIGSKIVDRTCKQRLRQNLSDISDAYLVWARKP